MKSKIIKILVAIILGVIADILVMAFLPHDAAKIAMYLVGYPFGSYIVDVIKC